ncbi:hypothetical protein D9Q98_003696 [Chlorella vulgaris]|uniref:SGNH hydrolase-type esterase domain-containing protein n=1 Tax=Chlorella vulgaris TaxID=3077 RepID=A0A9D4YZ76_CHLVU|nr:hypothetical protein D9Q98_003696 [Chlorella vulgaris]
MNADAPRIGRYLALPAAVAALLLLMHTPATARMEGRAARGVAAAAVTGPPAGSPYATVPAWVRAARKTASSSSSWTSYTANVAAVKAANNAGRRLEYVQWGDSITARLNMFPENKAVWNRVFASTNAVALGVGGDKVDGLAWRIVYGGERPAIAPIRIVLLIGVNDLNNSLDPVPRVDWLLGWLRATYPWTKMVLVGLMRNNLACSSSVPGVNAAYKAIAYKHRATFVDCGKALRDDQLLGKVHPNAAGYAKVLPCFKAAAGIK